MLKARLSPQVCVLQGERFQLQCLDSSIQHMFAEHLLWGMRGCWGHSRDGNRHSPSTPVGVTDNNVTSRMYGLFYGERSKEETSGGDGYLHVWGRDGTSVFNQVTREGDI